MKILYIIFIHFTHKNILLIKFTTYSGKVILEVINVISIHNGLPSDTDISGKLSHTLSSNIVQNLRN